jgi:protein TonB
MASWSYGQSDRRWSGSFGAIATIAVHLVVLLLFVLSGPTQPQSQSAPVSARLISEVPAEQQAEPQPLRANPVMTQPQLHMPVPEISLAPSPAGPSAPVSASTAAASSHAESQQATESAPRFDVDYLDNPPPRYPALSRRMREEGVVLLRVYVLANGAPEVVELKHSSGSARLDESALLAVRQWKFMPAQRAGQSVAAWVVVPVAFSLSA